MKVVILAGGFGTRILEESKFKPKPMIEANGRPLIWYIMKHFASFGHNDFIICAGYKQEYIKKWFYDYFICASDVCFDNRNGEHGFSVINNRAENWKVQVVDTGLTSNTGERIKRIKDLVGDDDFFITYGDCISDVNIDALVKTHNDLHKTLTLTAVNYPPTKGVILENNGVVTEFREKDKKDSVLINGGFMVAKKEIFGYFVDDNPSLELDVIGRMMNETELGCYKHYGEWCGIDSLNDKMMFEKKVDDFLFPWLS